MKSELPIYSPNKYHVKTALEVDGKQVGNAAAGHDRTHAQTDVQVENIMSPCRVDHQ